MKRTWIVLLLLALAGVGAQAQPSYHEVADVPTDLGLGTYPPAHVVRNSAGVHSPELVFPQDITPDALFQTAGGDWLLSPSATTDLGGTDYDPRDVVSFDGLTYSSYPPYGGAVGQIPAGSNVDAVLLDPGSGHVVVSFDVPTTISGTTYDPGDLVLYTGIFEPVPFFDASAAGIPPEVNVTAADIREPRLVLSVDVPFGSPPILPGQLLGWDGSILTTFDPQPAWPSNRSSHVEGLSFLPDPGGIGDSLRVSRLGAGQLRLQWASSSCAGGRNFGIYEGTLGVWYSHGKIDCEDAAPGNEEDIPLPGGSTYYLVVPHNDHLNANYAGSDEGDYGESRAGVLTAPRPPAPPVDACVANHLLGCSP